MIGLDTNILVRYFTQDDPVQSYKATVLIEQRLTEQSPGFVSIVAVDAAMLVLYFTQDDPVQSYKATVLIEQRLTEQSPGFVSIVALAETVWVLERFYRLKIG